MSMRRCAVVVTAVLVVRAALRQRRAHQEPLSDGTSRIYEYPGR